MSEVEWTADDLEKLLAEREAWPGGDTAIIRALDIAIAQAKAQQRVPDVPVLVHTNSTGGQFLYWQEGGQVSRRRKPDGTLSGPWTPRDPERYTPYALDDGSQP